MDNPIILLVVAALGLAGFTILLFAAWFMVRDKSDNKDDKSKRPAAKTAAPRSPAAAAPAAATDGLAAAGPASADRDTYEVLRVLRDAGSSQLIIEIGGTRYSRLEDVRDGAVYRGLMTTVSDLQTFAAVQPSAPAAMPNGATARALPANFVVPAEPLQTPSMNPFKQAAVLRQMAKNPPPVPLTITEQIDRMLQETLVDTPHTKRGLRVTTGPTGAALFHSDGKSYDSVDDVPDAEAQALIRAAVARWEASQ